LLDLDADTSSSKKMCYHSEMIINSNDNGARMDSQDVMTYSHYMRGSILSVPKLWQIDNGETLVVSVYSFLKTFLR
jgi:hypothetical protein